MITYLCYMLCYVGHKRVWPPLMLLPVWRQQSEKQHPASLLGEIVYFCVNFLVEINKPVLLCELDFDFHDLFRMELFHTSTSTTTSPIHNSLYSSTSIVDLHRNANFSLDMLAASVESTLAMAENGTIASSSTKAPGQLISPPFGIISFSNLFFFWRHKSWFIQ